MISQSFASIHNQKVDSIGPASPLLYSPFESAFRFGFIIASPVGICQYELQFEIEKEK